MSSVIYRRHRNNKKVKVISIYAIVICKKKHTPSKKLDTAGEVAFNKPPALLPIVWFPPVSSQQSISYEMTSNAISIRLALMFPSYSFSLRSATFFLRILFGRPILSLVPLFFPLLNEKKGRFGECSCFFFSCFFAARVEE